MKSKIRDSIMLALNNVRSGEPDKAISYIETALANKPHPDLRKLLEKAGDEAELGTLANAETYLEMAESFQPERKAKI